MADPVEWTKAYNAVRSAITATQAAYDKKDTTSLKSENGKLSGAEKNLHLVQREEGTPETKARTDDIKKEAKALLEKARLLTD